MVMSWVTPSRCKDSTTATMSSSFLVGFAREVPRMDPPEKWMRLTSPSLSGLMSSSLPFIRRSNPSRMPSTSTPCKRARIVAALITLLMPGAGPPPTKIPSFSLDTLDNSLLRANPSIGRLTCYGRAPREVDHIAAAVLLPGCVNADALCVAAAPCGAGL